MKKTILIVDDNEVERIVLAGFIENYYTILSATNGNEAIDQLQEHSNEISAIILDIVMPDMDGFEVLQHIRENACWLDLPIIITTSLEDQASREKALEYGVNGFLTKPYNRALLLHSLSNAVQLHETVKMSKALWRDQLTGLLNRESFFIEADHYLKTHTDTDFVLSCIDIDNFKVINDQYGTEKGDDVLRHVAACINEIINITTGIACRYSGDKFAVLFPSDFLKDLAIKKVHKNLSMPSIINKGIRFRIGRYVITDISVPISSIIDRATLAEESIKGRYDTYIAYYDNSMLSDLLHEQRVINTMDDALANHEFEAWFQPQYNHATGAMIGAEALVRWRHDDRLIPPNSFIPIFERNGFIYKLDQFIWEETCKLLRKFIDREQDVLPISVNISRYDLFQDNFVSTICSLIERYKLPVNVLRLEVTESAFSESTQLLVQIVNKLIDYGFTVEIDDFGSGYSSLNTLKDVPAEILKLDMKFLEDSNNSKRGGSIIESIVRMARWLGMAVIAEGVETQEQADYLLSIGCEYIQGYFYSKPIPQNEYTALCSTITAEPNLSRLRTVETWNNNAFWDPASMETLIFNSYVGGACIFEFHNGKTELLRFNKRFEQIFSDDFYFDFATNRKNPPFLDDSNMMLIIANIQLALHEKKESTCEICLKTRIGVTKYIRTTVRLIAVALDRNLFYCVINDITTQRMNEILLQMAEKKKNENARQLEFIMRNMNGGVSALHIDDDFNTNYVFHNEKYFDLFGYTAEQARQTRLNPIALIFKDDLPSVKEKIKQLKKDGKPVTIDYRIRRFDGKRVYLRSNSSLIYMEGYQDSIVISIINDITEQRELSDQLRAIVDNINGGVTATIVKNGNPEFVIVNDQYYQQIGYTKEQFEVECNKDKFNLIHPEDKDRIIKQFTSADGGKNRFTMEYRIIRRDGEIRYLQNNISIISIFGIDEPVQLSVANDITDLRLAQQKIVAFSEKLKSVINHAGNGITAVALRGNSTEFLFANQKYYDILGYSKDEVHITDINTALEAIHPDDKDRVFESVMQANKTLSDAELEYRIIHKNGKIIWIKTLITITELVDVDCPVQIATFIDITSQKESNEQLNFLNNAAHDILAQEDSDIAINTLLKSLMCFFEADRSYVIEIDDQNKETNNTYEICATGVESEMALLQKVPFDVSAYWFSVLKKNECVIIKDVSKLGNDKKDLRELLQQQNIKSLIVAPLWRAGQLIGFAGLDNPRAELNQMSRLTALCDYIAILIMRRDMSVQKMLPVALSTVLEASSDLSYIKTKDLHYLCCSSLAAKEIGLKDPSEIVGKTDYDLFDKKLADSFVQTDNLVLEKGNALTNITEQLPQKNNTIMFINTSKFPLLDSSGNVIGIYGVSHDITEAREKENQLKLLTSSIPGGLASYLIHKDTVETLFINDGFYRSQGYSREEFETLTQKTPLTLMVEEDRQKIRDMIFEIRSGKSDNSEFDFVYRCMTKTNDIRWMKMKGRVSKLGEDSYILNVVQLDITEQKQTEDNLHLAEEEYRLATKHSGSTICRFDIAKRTLTITSEAAKRLELPETIQDIPYGRIKLGKISPNTTDIYATFYEDIINGKEEGTATFQKLLPSGWRWILAHSTTLFTSDGKPVSAIISYTDITEQQEKDAIYNKWHQSLEYRDRDSYTLLRCNLGKNATFDSWEGDLLKTELQEKKYQFNDFVKEYVERYVYSDDREKCFAFLNADTLIANYYHDHRIDTLEYRENLPNNKKRWLSISVDLIEYPNSNDVEAYFMFENINKQKKNEIITLQRSQTDALTGALNRGSFVKKLKTILRASKSTEMHALIMFDIDNFKQINDTFGHTIGDRVLCSLSQQVRTCLRKGDLLGRLGGDEFFVLLCDVPNKALVERKAKQICDLSIVTEGNKHVTISMGIAMIPQDGNDFDVLYKKVDGALYEKKKDSKNGYIFVDDL